MSICVQIIKFIIIGTLSFFIDYSLMIFFTEYFKVHYLISSTLSFTISLIFNYKYSMKFVFKRKDDIDIKVEFMIFVLFSILGLIINQLSMWIFVEKFNIIYKISKIFATLVVMFWNFITRKIFLENKS